MTRQMFGFCLEDLQTLTNSVTHGSTLTGQMNRTTDDKSSWNHSDSTVSVSGWELM
jgi:hypothetical protein